MKLKKIVLIFFVLGWIMNPICIYADESVVAQSQDGTKTYTDYESAWIDAQNGTTIVMLNDWNLRNRLIVEEGKTVHIEMNGYKMNRHSLDQIQDDGEVIRLNKNSTLTLSGNMNPEKIISFDGYKASAYTDLSIQSGGLVTGGSNYNGAGGIHMLENTTLYLDHVAVAGNNSGSPLSYSGGGINMYDDNCTIHMTDAYVSYNTSRFGGGIGVTGDYGAIDMNDSSIDGNYASQMGGGIYCGGSDFSIHMSNNSTINANQTHVKGAGIYCGQDCEITSADATAEISKNVVYTSDDYGGAIYSEDYLKLEGITFDSNSSVYEGGALYIKSNLNSKKGEGATIENCQFYRNTSKYGGAIYLDAENCKISNCFFQENIAKKEGGAIYNCDDNNILENCTITNNSAKLEGGGIYVNEKHDITLSGQLIIKNNYRAENTQDDLFLEKTWYSTAYIKGEISSDSSVGIRTADDGITQIGTDIPSDCSKSFFLNDTGIYYIEYKDNKLYKSSSSPLSSIFGNANLGAAVIVMVGIVVVGVICLGIHKKKGVK